MKNNKVKPDFRKRGKYIYDISLYRCDTCNKQGFLAYHVQPSGKEVPLYIKNTHTLYKWKNKDGKKGIFCFSCS